ncbi:MAG: hypothetical protein EBT93_06440 [Alphaproteobacteria bacterium]|nr:hypothetical protein [Alphaproteobacteria bacterium]
MANSSKSNVEFQLGEFAFELAWSDIPADIKYEAKRSILNIIGTAFSGCLEPAIDKALKVMKPYAGVETASLIGRKDAILKAFVFHWKENSSSFPHSHFWVFRI